MMTGNVQRQGQGSGILDYDVVVLGAGAAGVSAATAAASMGVRVLLVESGSFPGGELLSGMPIDGAVNAWGEWILGGMGRTFLERCRERGGYVEVVNDYRLIRYVAFDPEIMKFALVDAMRAHKVDILLQTLGCGVEVECGTIRFLYVLNKSGRTTIRAPVYLDCSGDGDLAVMAGADLLTDGVPGESQPVSLLFRMGGVETEPLLDFARKNPSALALGESAIIRAGRTDAELAEALYRQGRPALFFRGDGTLLAPAIDRGELFPTALVMIQPSVPRRNEVCVNATRVANVDAMRTGELSAALGPLMDQVDGCAAFLTACVPGFERASLTAVAPRLGIRETRRIAGEYVLSRDEVLSGKKSAEGVAKGCHHVDIHQSGTGQVRIPVTDGGSYDIAWGCLIARKLKNLLVAGRCASADRDANGSMRVMGSCMGMGHAAGIATALFLEKRHSDFRSIDVKRLRDLLRETGAILDGTH